MVNHGPLVCGDDTSPDDPPTTVSEHLPAGAPPAAHRRYTEPAGSPATRPPTERAPTERPAAERPHPEQLTGGRLTDGLVRIGDTVRRPAVPQSFAVADYLDHLALAGFDACPRFLGRDDEGRDVLTFVAGEVPGDPVPAWAAGEELLVSVAALLRRLHEASAGYAADRGFAAAPGTVWRRDLVKVELPDPEPAPELISHTDLVPQNVVVRDGRAVAFIDFELAGPTTRMLNLYTAAAHWVPLCPPERVPAAWQGIDQAARLRLFADGYGLDDADRLRLPDFGIDRAEITWRRLRASAAQLGGGWARLWDSGAGDAVLARRAWLQRDREVLLTALA